VERNIGWLIGALFQPWVRAKGERRRHLLIAWLWFLGLLIVLSIPGANQQRYLLPIMPAVGLLVGVLSAVSLWKKLKRR
jgi:4-amino-4-deoxy-L-arabinose transferase-like glycosyltransferase